MTKQTFRVMTFKQIISKNEEKMVSVKKPKLNCEKNKNELDGNSSHPLNNLSFIAQIHLSFVRCLVFYQVKFIEPKQISAVIIGFVSIKFYTSSLNKKILSWQNLHKYCQDRNGTRELKEGNSAKKNSFA